MTFQNSFEAAEALINLVGSGAAESALSKGQTTAADAIIAIDKTIDALNAWKLVLLRGSETAEILKDGLK